MFRADAPLAGRRVLVVEDEYLIASEMRRWLQAAGSEVLGPVPSVDRALDLIEEHRPDVAVLDVNLGAGDDAYPIADRLGALGVPYLFATGDVRLADTSIYRDRPRLEKPFLARELVRALSAILAEGRA
jgi:DNA-binding response OmpR family regulator